MGKSINVDVLYSKMQTVDPIWHEHCHAQVFAKMLLVLDGEITIKYPNQNETTLTRGNMAIIPPCAEVFFYNKCGLEETHYLCHFIITEDDVNIFNKYEFAPYVKLTYIGETAKQFKLLSKYILEDNLKNKLLAKSCITNLLNTYIEIGGVETLDDFSSFTEQVMKILKNDLQGKKSINELAKLVGYSSDCLIKSFKKTTGITPKQYNLNHRIEQAKKLIISSNLPFYEIMKKFGFYNATYFARVIKNHTGLSPSNLRKKMNNIDTN